MYILACTASGSSSLKVDKSVFDLSIYCYTSHGGSYSQVECMLEEYTRTELKQRQWTVAVNNVTPLPHKASFNVLWKMYTNGVAIMLSIHHDEGQFVVYEDVGHAASGTNRTEHGRFSTVNAAVQQLLQVCYESDSTWEWTVS
jgi:hypothetical protein